MFRKPITSKTPGHLTEIPRYPALNFRFFHFFSYGCVWLWDFFVHLSMYVCILVYTYIPIPVFIYIHIYIHISSYIYYVFFLKRQKWQKCLTSALFLLGCSSSPRIPKNNTGNNVKYRFSDETFLMFVVKRSSILWYFYFTMIWTAMVCLGPRRGSTFLADIVT